MKDNIVFWGDNEQDKKILVILRLRNNDHKVDIWTFLKDKLQDEFVEKMFQDWDEIDVSTFPEHHTYEERDVTASDLLPETIKAYNTDLVIRTEEEWRVKVLSSRIFQMMSNEIEALHGQVETLDQYDKTLWETAKGYNNKLNAHSQERNFTREQYGELNKILNECFEKLKTKMNEENKQYEQQAQINREQILQKLKELDEQAENEALLAKTFDDLKALQAETKNMRLTREGRKEIWDKLNESFQNVKDRRKSMAGFRLEKRINGLQNAVNKMANSIRRDKDSVDFQNRQSEHINAGKLEIQLRAAKAKMLNSRIESKEKKLEDMEKTLSELKGQLSSIKAKAQKESDKAKAKKTSEAKTKESAKVAANPKADAPKEGAKVAETAEAPKTEEPAKEEPKVAEAPKAEEPKAEETVVEAPKAEEPKAEETVAEAPKAEEATNEDSTVKVDSEE